MKQENKTGGKILIKLIPYAVIAILIAVILNLKGCFGPPQKGDKVTIGGKDYQVIKREIDTFYKEKKVVEYRRGKDIPYEVQVIKEIPADVDTLSILKDYYAKVFYKDTLNLKDTLGYLVVQDTITENRISSRGYEAFIRIPVIKETLYLKELSNDFYFGPSIQAGRSLSIGADAHLKTKKDLLLGFGFGVNSNVSPYLRGSIGWKINK